MAHGKNSVNLFAGLFGTAESEVRLKRTKKVQNAKPGRSEGLAWLEMISTKSDQKITFNWNQYHRWFFVFYSLEEILFIVACYASMQAAWISTWILDTNPSQEQKTRTSYGHAYSSSQWNGEVHLHVKNPITRCIYPTTFRESIPCQWHRPLNDQDFGPALGQVTELFGFYRCNLPNDPSKSSKPKRRFITALKTFRAQSRLDPLMPHRKRTWLT